MYRSYQIAIPFSSFLFQVPPFPPDIFDTIKLPLNLLPVLNYWILFPLSSWPPPLAVGPAVAQCYQVRQCLGHHMVPGVKLRASYAKHVRSSL